MEVFQILQNLSFEKQQKLIFFAAIAVLVIASAIAWLIKVVVANNQSHPVVDNLIQRINAWWVMVLVIALAVYFGNKGIVILFFIISLLALREFVTLIYTKTGDYRALMLSFFFFLPYQYWLVYTQWYGLFGILIPVYAFLTLPILSALSGDINRFLERTALVQWSLMICVYCISHVPALLILELDDFSHNVLLIIFLILVVQGSDILQYIFGKLFGKTLIAPNVSPSKTWEGFVLGSLSASLFGMSLSWITPFTILQAGLISLIVCLMGFLGGLVMSSIKRDRGVKDWGNLIQGHGGMLDRLDSVCFAAPVFFHIVRYWW